MKKCIALLFSIIALPFALNAYTTNFYTFAKGDKRIVMIGERHEKSSSAEEVEKLEIFHFHFFKKINEVFGTRALVFTEFFMNIQDPYFHLLQENPKENQLAAELLTKFSDIGGGLTLTSLLFPNTGDNYKKIVFDYDRNLDHVPFEKRLADAGERMNALLNEESLKSKHSVINKKTKKFIEEMGKIPKYLSNPEFSYLMLLEGCAADYNFLRLLIKEESNQENDLFVLVAGGLHILHLASLVEEFEWTVIDKHDSTNPADWKTEDPLLKPLLPSLLPSLCAEKSCANKGSKKCDRCKARVYCSEECQRRDWKSGHKEVCRPNQYLKVQDATSADQSTPAAPIGVAPQSENPWYLLYGLRFSPLGFRLPLFWKC